MFKKKEKIIKINWCVFKNCIYNKYYSLNNTNLEIENKFDYKYKEFIKAKNITFKLDDFSEEIDNLIKNNKHLKCNKYSSLKNYKINYKICSIHSYIYEFNKNFMTNKQINKERFEDIFYLIRSLREMGIYFIYHILNNIVIQYNTFYKDDELSQIFFKILNFYYEPSNIDLLYKKSILINIKDNIMVNTDFIEESIDNKFLYINNLRIWIKIVKGFKDDYYKVYSLFTDNVCKKLVKIEKLDSKLDNEIWFYSLSFVLSLIQNYDKFYEIFDLEQFIENKKGILEQFSINNIELWIWLIYKYKKFKNIDKIKYEFLKNYSSKFFDILNKNIIEIFYLI